MPIKKTCTIPYFVFALSPLFCIANSETMLSQAEKITEVYSQQMAKADPPSECPQSLASLQLSSVWLGIDLNQFMGENPLTSFTDTDTWSLLREIGIESIRMKHLRQEGDLKIDPKWKSLWPQVVENANRIGISLIGDLIGNSTIAGKDFQKAVQKAPDYLNLYHLIEIDPKDWNLLPNVPLGSLETNIPWLSLQELHSLGYVPEQFAPYVKLSAWNATAKITGVDGKVRRWIYLKEGENRPVLSWLSPTFAALKLAAGDALNCTNEFGMQMLHLDGNIPMIAQETLALLIRQMQAFSVSSGNGSLQSIRQAPTDLVYDTATRAALLHALIAQDAIALRMIYQLILDEKIETKRLVHVLQPFDEAASDWIELMQSPKKKFRYAQEQVTGEVLRQRLLKEDLSNLKASETIPLTTWPDHCAKALGVKDFDPHREEITNAHLLLSFTYAMQPGAFSISAADLLGALPDQAKDLSFFNPNTSTLYASLPTQLRNPKSFASSLKRILSARRESGIAQGELVAVLPSPHPGTLLLLHRLPKNRFMHLLAINFARKPAQEAIEIPEIRQTTAINVMSKLAEEKIFSSAQFSFTLPPMSGKSFYFQPKYYD